MPESVLETRLLRLMKVHRLPPPSLQHRVRAGSSVARVDFAYPELKLAIEADGYRHHSRPVDWERDRRRRNRLTEAGWHVVHVTWNDLVQRPEEVILQIRGMMRRLRPRPDLNRRPSP
ncbi:MAG: endonuclease domain-containing protein [Actinomycetota bacterium]